jgi:lipopolysaccharide export system protein LptA
MIGRMRKMPNARTLQARPARSVAALIGLLCCAAVHAEHADRSKPITIHSNGEPPAVLNLNRRTAVLAGGVVVTQGTLEIHADRLEVSEDPMGPTLGVAFGSPASPARFRQKGDRPDEWGEGNASRIEYDSDANRIRFVGDAHVRVLRGSVVAESANAPVVTYDSAAGTIVMGGGRTTLVLSPRAGSTADALPSAAQAASQP